MNNPSSSRPRLTADRSYTSGHYFADPHRHQGDARLKATSLLELYRQIEGQHDLTVRSYADVGCGSGAAAELIAAYFTSRGTPLEQVKGYDVSPHVATLPTSSVQFVHGDFAVSDDCVDLVTLFDVFEHVPNPVEFIAAVAARSELIGFHIPLENSIHVNLRGFNEKLADPGHLLFLDVAQALNLLAMAGLRVLDYRYTFGFMVDARSKSFASKVLYPFRRVLARVSPWLLSKTLGGLSLTVLAVSPSGMERIRFAPEREDGNAVSPAPSRCQPARSR